MMKKRYDLVLDSVCHPDQWQGTSQDNKVITVYYSLDADTIEEEIEDKLDEIGLSEDDVSRIEEISQEIKDEFFSICQNFLENEDEEEGHFMPGEIDMDLIAYVLVVPA